MKQKQRKESKKKTEQKKGKENEENKKEKEDEEKEAEEENLKEKQKEAVLRAACALLNTGGGIIQMEAENQDYSYSTDALGQDLERALKELVNPARMDDFFEFSQQGTKFLMFVKSWCSSIKRARICSISTGLWQRSETSAEQVSSSAANEFLQKKERKLSENSKIYQFYERNTVNANELLDFGESLTVDFKDFGSKNVLVRLRECLPRYISAFANTAGGFLFIGVNDARRVTGCGRGESEEKLETRVAEICSKAIAVHQHSCSKSHSWSAEHRIIPVLDKNVTESRSYVLAIKIPTFCCAVFEKDPDSWQIKDSQLSRLTADQWLEMMESTDPVNKLIGSFKQLSIKDTPPQCRTVYGFQEEHLKPLQDKLFPVDKNDISIGPDPLMKDLFEKYEKLGNLQTLERQENAPGVLIFSRSWAVDIGRVRKSSVICDAVLICQNSLPCLYTVVEEGSPDAWEYATSTAFHLKQKLVNVGGCSERVCVVPKLVHCHTLKLIPREKSSPDGMSYPDCYTLGSEDQIRSVLRSLVIVLLSFTSALSDKLGCEFLNLLTEEQFEFLQTYEDIRELFIHGLPGTGKTVLAAEKIKRIKNAYDCKDDNVLYICENQPLKYFMRKQKICFCETRKCFMMKREECFSEVQHIIVDEGQNFRAEDGDWIQKARNIVKENGVFWVFLDYFQQSHITRSGLPPLPSQSKAYLCTIVRNSKQVSERLKKEIDGICKSFTKTNQLANHLKSMFSKLRFIHSFSGSYVVEKMAERKVVPYLRNKLYHLLDDGRSSKDIAILCSTQKDRDKIQLALESKRSGPRICFTSAEDMDSDVVVLDSIRRFSGLERNIVILIDPQAHPSQCEVEKNLLVGAISRARIQLIVIDLISSRNVRDSAGDGRDSDGDGSDSAGNERDSAGDGRDSAGNGSDSAGDGRDSAGNGRDSPGNGTGFAVANPEDGRMEID
ncbi:schlafen family member 13-like isoform X2 [Anguilla anguilla]|nr:schlafen family member 13-like isoform X2 [Anguilla anguilla]